MSLRKLAGLPLAIGVLLALAVAPTPGRGAGKRPLFEAAKQEVWVNETGDTMTGPLIVNAPPGTVGITVGNGSFLELRNGGVLWSGNLFLHANGEDTSLGIHSLSSSLGLSNTAVGAYSLELNTVGANNTALGVEALASNTEGRSNTAVGWGALGRNSVSRSNTAVGVAALFMNADGGSNTAVGANALQDHATGNDNVAIGHRALFDHTDGSNNIAIGAGAGSSGVASDTIFVGNGVNSCSNCIHIGTEAVHTSTHIAGIRGVTTFYADAIPVLIDSLGQLGTVSSSREVKEDIHDLGDASARVLDLRPVAFRYRQPFADGGKPLQYGLIAEEVAEVFPDLAVRGPDGRPETVKYHLLPTLLLNEVRRQEARIAALERQLEARCSGR